MMDVSRREFLKGLAASAVALGLDPYAGIAVSDDLYENARLGLSFRKPRGWEYDSIADFAAVRERSVLLNEIPTKTHPFKDPENLPVVIVSDPKYRQGDFAPAIMLWDEPLHHPNPSDEIAAHWRLIRGLGRCYKDVHVIEQPSPLKVSGATGTQCVFSYRHELEDGQVRHLREHALLFFRFPRVHTYYITDENEKNYVPSQTVTKFIQSMRYH